MNPVTQTTVDQKRDAMARAIGKIATGVYVVTFDINGKPDGMLASWIGQAAFEPPMVTLAIKKGRPLLEKINIGKPFIINVLSKKNMDAYKNFAKPYTPELDRFEGIERAEGDHVAPVFAQAVAYMSCVVDQMVVTGDHILVVSEVREGGLLHAESEPMVHLRSNGFQY